MEQIYARVETATVKYTQWDISLAEGETVTNLSAVDGKAVVEIQDASGKTRTESKEMPEGSSIIDYGEIYNKDYSKVVGYRVIFSQVVGREVEQD